MRLKTIASGVLASLGCYFSLMRLAYDALPAQLIADWPPPFWEGIIEEKWVSLAIVSFAALSLFLGGWLSASWNRARNWKESVRFGANAGLIAGALSFSFVGAPWAGLLAQKEVLEKVNISLTEIEGGRILVNAVVGTIQRSYSMVWEFLIPAIILGALGGILFVLDIKTDEKVKGPRKSGWLFRLPAYTLSLSGIVSFIIMYAIIAVLPEIITTTAMDYSMVPDLPPELILPITIASTIPFFAIPFLLSAIWVARRWGTDKQGGFLFLAWVFLFWVLVYFLSNNTFRYLFSLFEIGLSNFVISVIATIFGVFLLMWFLSNEPTEDRLTFSFSEWMGYALAQGILGGTQLFASSMAFALSVVLIAVVNIPHLMSIPSDTPIPPPAEQIETLFVTQQRLALLAMGGMFVVALVLGGITALVRRIAGMNKKTS